ncbi:Electron transfer flavoprotein alpha/beta-subunit [Megalodesulfovibrio gigas]|uniref:Putative Electron transfer flavoprotein alpha/beta-subunit n=1 Tax=Megalodesulfovibrio gigas (strain ATCC 19364 / DSM 1382 / NCIMB 9332 / VKM B-1759) TaxID=1121448 RepID=T2G9Q6_MEGG1|nr:Electron transfer flavoprotein alpha/beta-subunit [Megalodesulfovibrio gigas]AGW13325.1 putative Electron transfer flavoprotein alpha/beta-subunit [Megalodesulfovibrio gigas DSM 1382 = ATCC 19364]
METILLLLAPELDGTLGKNSLEAVTAAATLATDLGATFKVGLFGKTVQPLADQLAGCGAEAFFAVSDDALGMPRYATDAAAAAALVQAAAPSIVLAPATSRLARILPGVAQRTGGRVDTFVTELAAENGAPVITRWYYRQRMAAKQSRAQRPWCISLAGGCAAPYAGAAGQAAATAVPFAVPASATRIAGVDAPAADAQTIRPDAQLLFVTGAGWTKKQAGAVRLEEASSLILGFLDATQSSLGSTKSLVDLGGEGHGVLPFLSHMHQVGQTGSTPRHKKGLATCCHGEEPHVVGWRFITERRAVNLDASCGWAQGKADVLYVADAFAVMEKVNALLKG